ncbi:hypothetical protein [[Clostridium] dakarense]|uniref:hypothetical protein n=1 Tax=Faecalimicrobium dakarense TaxID=1301100 RepID=UPI0004AE6972|nr:hypothetical protein [[Clostridium] dakarense]
MKKILITMLSIIFISTSISFAYAQNPDIEKFISDLDLIKNDLTILTKKIMDVEHKSKEEINEIKKDIASSSSEINYALARVSSLYKNETNPSLRKEYSAISNTLSSYSFALDSFLLYLANPDDINQFLDATYEIKTGNNSLNDIKESLTRKK